MYGNLKIAAFSCRSFYGVKAAQMLMFAFTHLSFVLFFITVLFQHKAGSHAST